MNNKDKAEKKFLDKYSPLVDKDKLSILFSVVTDPVVQSPLSRGKQPNLKTVRRLFEERGLDLPKNINADADEEDDIKVVNDSKKSTDHKLLDILNRIDKTNQLILEMMQSTVEFGTASDCLDNLSRDQLAERTKRLHANQVATHEFKKSFKFYTRQNSDDMDVVLQQIMYDAFLILDEIINDGYIKNFTLRQSNYVLDKKIKTFVITNDTFAPNDPLYVKIKAYQEVTKSYLGVDPIIIVVSQTSSSNRTNPLNALDGRKHASIAFYLNKDDLFNQFRFKLERDESYIPSETDISIIHHPQFWQYFWYCIKDAYTHLYGTLQTGDTNPQHDEIFNLNFKKLFVDC